MINNTMLEGRKFRKLTYIDGEKKWQKFSAWVMLHEQPFIIEDLNNIKEVEKE